MTINLGKIGKQPWLTVSLLAAACCLLAFLQYRWITEFSSAERDRLRGELQGRLNLLSRSFGDELSSADSALTSRREDDLDAARLAARYELWRQSHGPLFRRIGLVTAADGKIDFLQFDSKTSSFLPADWPPDWDIERRRFTARLNHTAAPPLTGNAFTLVEIPRFGRRDPDREPLRQESVIAELDLDYLRDVYFPQLLQKFLGDRGKLEYDAEVSVNVSNFPPVVVYRTGAESPAAKVDASIALPDPQIISSPPNGQRRGGGPNGPPPDHRRGPGPPPQMRGPRGPDSGFQNDTQAATWLLSVRHHAGSLESLADQARSRNLALSLGLLMLILAAVASLLRLSRQSQRLAELQMNFVAGVSHELRTPLTVIRTAAFNLRGKLAHRPDQVERYGKLIQEESEKLGELVEQVLRFASGQAGHVIREREQVEVCELIEVVLQSSQEPAEARGVMVESHIDSDLPPVLADKLAMQHAIRNLVENALKYGTDARPWVGVFASLGENRGAGGTSVEIRVADHGPGIPDEEQAHIFDPFFRGRRAVSDQVHGTGLGLSLVKKIIEAHGGTIRVDSDPAKGTEFIVRIPVAPPKVQHELAHSLS